MEKYFKNKFYASLIAIFTCFLWGTAIPMIKSTYEIMNISSTEDKIFLAGIRFFLAGILVIVYKLIFDREEKTNFKKLDYKFLFFIALTQVTIQYMAYYIGLSNTAGVKSSIIQGFNSIITVVVASLVFKDDKMNKEKLLAIIFGVLAILIANLSGKGIDFSFSLNGEGLVFVSMICGSLGTIIMRKFGQDKNSYIVSIFQFIIGSSILIILSKIFGAKIYFNKLGLILVLYGAFVSATAFLLWYLLLKYQKASNVGIFKLFIPVFGSMLSVIFLNEKYTLNLIISLFLTIVSTLLVNIKKGKTY
ncbi:MAG: DMT family transporter [Peptoniphilaceae bacterium]|nr:DMT family transporter [Peptoniphilaceae bacterium]MDD7382944.1 DMT family transporter [Peptoniphilaceae bacterium]MDY3737695.1 DMT family transporter [Peptoniphilaceae bacterium]